MSCTQRLDRYLEGQGHSMTIQQNSFRPITLWFEVEFNNYFTGMITILRQCVACNIWVATLKAKVTAWPFSKIVSGPTLCYLKSDFTTAFDKLLLCVQYLFGEHYPVPTGSLFCLALLHNVIFRRKCSFNFQWFLLNSLIYFVFELNRRVFALRLKCSWNKCLHLITCLRMSDLAKSCMI